MARTAADFMAEALQNAGVRRVYGVVGDSLNGFTDALRRIKSIDWIHVRHEEAAAFAAGAEAHLTGELAVCAGSCGPGNLHLINGLYDCHRSRVPVMAQDLDQGRVIAGCRGAARSNILQMQHGGGLGPHPTAERGVFD